MREWWQRRSLRLRLALWFTLVASGILLGLTPVVYWLVGHRLHVELDQQLHIDWDLVAAHLETDEAGRIRWKKDSPATPESPGYAATWFDVWSDDKTLLRHWPAHWEHVSHPPPPRKSGGQRAIFTIELDTHQTARTLEQPVRIRESDVILRVFRDETGLRRTLQQILIGFGLGVPLAAVLASFGGYVMAGRMLSPISAMAEHARQITSESLNQRLPIPNPHDELGQLATVFNQTLQRLQNSFETLKTFTADASHELRTPLTALRAVGEVALRGNGDAKALRETVASMLEEAQRLQDLINSMLLLACMESGRAAGPCDLVQLDEFMTEICRVMEVLAENKRQIVETSLQPNLIVKTDRVLLRHAVINILHNAIQYSPSGTRVQLRSFLHDKEAVIEIIDEGPGIAPEYHEKVFERFFRVDKARSRMDGGAGLGLAIAKLSLAQLGGTIKLDSQLGAGSRFRISLPAEM